MKTPRHRSLLRAILASGAVVVLGSGCSQEQADSPLSDLAVRGRAVYLNTCIACHNANPGLDGSVGPANAGASEALLTAKILHGEYPPGYTPKRPGSKAMPVFPYLEEQIPALAAYLDEYAKLEEFGGQAPASSTP